MVDLAGNLTRVRERLATAAQRVGRKPEEITLIAVSKTRPAEEIAAAAAAGAVDFGENYVQELVAKQAALNALQPPPQWHFIGHLQRNKARSLVPFCALIHVVDSVALATEIDRRAEQVGRLQPVLLQVDLAGETTKFGCPEGALEPVAEALASLAHLDWQGLMTIPPAAAKAEQSRPYYRRLAQLRETLATPERPLPQLSMGMSGDYEVAIEEGATLVRVGTAIFGPRQYPTQT